MGESTYLIRYGVMGRVGRFRGVPQCGGPFWRGQSVVIQSRRGVELGEVLVPLDAAVAPSSIGGVKSSSGEDASQIATTDVPRVLRAATSDDIARAENAGGSRPDRFMRCQRIFQEEGWPWELLDVEPLLDGSATVLHVLGPHELDEASVRARFRVVCDFDVVLEPTGTDREEYESEEINADHECGSAGCGSGGGCGVTASPQRGARELTTEISQASPGPASRAGCESCWIGQWKSGRSREPASSS